MTLHVVYTHQCGACQAFYIPYDDVPCPRCGQTEAERFDYIPQAAASMRYNKETGGSYTPPAWWVSSLGDHILSLLFALFDGFSERHQHRSFDEYLSARLNEMTWGDQEYLKGHLEGIARRVRQELAAP
jgi:hypothetical protein